MKSALQLQAAGLWAASVRECARIWRAEGFLAACTFSDSLFRACPIDHYKLLETAGKLAASSEAIPE